MEFPRLSRKSMNEKGQKPQFLLSKECFTIIEGFMNENDKVIEDIGKLKFQWHIYRYFYKIINKE